MLYETYDAPTITDTTPTKYNEVYAAAILALPKSSLRRCHRRPLMGTDVEWPEKHRFLIFTRTDVEWPETR